MSFLEELEQNKKENNNSNKSPDKTPRQLWESCFKYFQHFTKIIRTDDSEFESEFSIVFLNTKKPCKITGPYDISRSQDENTLKFELKLITKLDSGIKIRRKDNRSAELLQSKLYKESILSTVKVDNENNHFIELKPEIQSIFKMILKDGVDFYIEYKNINTTTFRSFRIPIESINQDYMDELAKYIIGKNPDLYTESISDHQITKIREKIEFEKKLKEARDLKYKIKIEKQQEQEELRKANTIKEKSKTYLKVQRDKLKSKILDQINKIKPR